MIAIISKGGKTAHVQLLAEQKQLAGALVYLGENHASDYELKCNEENRAGLKISLDCHGLVENAIAKSVPKTYCSNLLEHKRVKNTGQVAQHYLQDHHPAIVDRDLFDRVQSEYARRNAKKVNNGNPYEAPKKSRYNSKYALTDILVCGHCGSPFSLRKEYMKSFKGWGK